jgi:hypothetical protein
LEYSPQPIRFSARDLVWIKVPRVVREKGASLRELIVTMQNL